MDGVQEAFQKTPLEARERGPDPLGSRKQEGALDQAGAEQQSNSQEEAVREQESVAGKAGEGVLPSSLISQCNREIGRLLPRELLFILEA